MFPLSACKIPLLHLFEAELLSVDNQCNINCETRSSDPTRVLESVSGAISDNLIEPSFRVFQ